MILKHSKTNWIEINKEGLRFFIENPTIKQQIEIKRKGFEGALIVGEDENKLIKDLPKKDQADLLILLEEIKLLRMKYQIKDWEGITDSEGKIVKPKLIFNEKLQSYEIDNEQFNMLVESLTKEETIKINDLIKSETEFTEADKKK